MHETLLDQYLRDWLKTSTPYLSDKSACLSETLELAPINERTQEELLPRGTWVVVERDGKLVVFAGIALGEQVGEKGYSTVVCNENSVITKSFWVRNAETEWECHYSLQETLPPLMRS